MPHKECCQCLTSTSTQGEIAGGPASLSVVFTCPAEWVTKMQGPLMFSVVPQTLDFQHQLALLVVAALNCGWNVEGLTARGQEPTGDLNPSEA